MILARIKIIKSTRLAERRLRISRLGSQVRAAATAKAKAERDL